jgi:hypothetical protein
MNRQQLDNLEARFGYRAAARLSESADALPHDIRERLKVARTQALARRKLAKVTQASTAEANHTQVSVNADGTLSAHQTGPSSGKSGKSGMGAGLSALLEWVLPAVVLAVALIGLSEWQHSQQISQTAEIDAAVLADELPTQAYTDPGFAQFLKVEGEMALADDAP